VTCVKPTVACSAELRHLGLEAITQTHTNQCGVKLKHAFVGAAYITSVFKLSFFEVNVEAQVFVNREINTRLQSTTPAVAVDIGAAF
jgi:hypothetical protein